MRKLQPFQHASHEAHVRPLFLYRYVIRIEPTWVQSNAGREVFHYTLLMKSYTTGFDHRIISHSTVRT